RVSLSTDAAPPRIYPLSLHDALPIYPDIALHAMADACFAAGADALWVHARKAWLQGLSPKENREVPPLDHGLVYRLKAGHPRRLDRKSTRLNSSHVKISYAVFCLKKI